MCNFLIVAHRGASGLAPENTIPAFMRALEYDVDFVECDVRVTKDKVLIVIHDKELSRITNGSGLVREKTFNEIRTLDAGSWFSKEFEGTKIPTLEEVLQLFSDKKQCLIIEIKDPGIEKDVIYLVKKMNMLDKVAIASFSLDSLVNVRRLDKTIPLIAISYKFSERLLQAILKIGIRILALRYDAITADVVERCHKKGVLVNAWVINTIKDAITMLRKGVDIISTDFPNVLCEFRRKLRTRIYEVLEETKVNL